MTQPAKTPLPLVAIVTPVYNGEAYLAETMASVQAQTYPNIVHVVLDNASTDGSAAIIDSYRNKKIPLIVGKNEKLLPMDENWNAALKFIPAGTAYFRILCADDVLMPEATTRMVELAESDPAITTVCTAVYHNKKEENFNWPADRTVIDGREALKRYYIGSGWIEARQAMMRIDALTSADPFFDLHVGHSADIDAVLRMLTRGKFGFLQERLAMVREYPGNATQSEMRPLYIHFNDWLIMMRRYGRYAFGDAEYEKLDGRFRRFYFRRLLSWRFVKRNRRAFDLHMKLLAKIDARPKLLDYADAAFDLPLRKMGMRQGWFTYPF